MKISDKAYNFMKDLVTSWLPQIGLAVIALDSIGGWNIPADQINRTIIVICSLLGVFLKISTVNYLENKDTQTTFESYNEDDLQG